MVRLSVASIALILVASVATAQNFFKTANSEGKSYLLLMHPTTTNVETIHYLVEHDIFKVDSNVEFVGVYLDQDDYNYDKTIKLIKGEGFSKFHLQEIAGEISLSNVYQQNDLTDDFEELFQHSIGAMFFGGPDMPTELYKQENQYSQVYDPARHLFEVSFLFHLLGGKQDDQFEPLLEKRKEYVVSGICLGMQQMNVATGGTMIQDIPAQLYSKYTPEETVELGMEQMHRNSWQKILDDDQLMGCSFHAIKFSPDSFFPERMGVLFDMKPVILSSHHQAVLELGKGWIVTAYSPDGKVVEGIRHNIYPLVFGVQFHPEIPALYENMEPYKFQPEGELKTFHQWVGEESVNFHRKYWEYVSNALREARDHFMTSDKEEKTKNLCH